MKKVVAPTQQVDGISWATLEQIAEAEGTPFFVYQPAAALRAYDTMMAGLAEWGDAVIAYSLKTNPLPALLQDLRSRGAWIEVVSGAEYALARRAGFPGEQIVFNGPVKTAAALRTALADGVFSINIDSMDELALLRDNLPPQGAPVPVGVRLCPSLTQSRFGMELRSGEVAFAVGEILQDPRLRLACLHVHLGTQIEEADRYAQALVEVRDFWQKTKLNGDVCLDFGGGHPYWHNHLFADQPFVPREFFASLAKLWGSGRRPRLFIEPGRWIAAPSFLLVARVVARKPRMNAPTIVVVDTGTNHNIMGAFYEHSWAFQQVEAYEEDFRICGPLCMEDDSLSGHITTKMPAPGSLVAMLNAGAYSICLARSFIQPLPGIVAATANGGYTHLIAPEQFAYGWTLGPDAPVATVSEAPAIFGRARQAR
jgi:diaminopimelate decarboxylase